MNVARLNFSHGDYDTHKNSIELIRQISKRFDRPVAILQDLQGVKIRVGLIEDGAVALKKGQDTSRNTGRGYGESKSGYLSLIPHLLRDVKKGCRILLDDGLIQLSVLGKEKNALKTRVIEGGLLRDRKGVNLPGDQISVKSFTEKDEKDLSLEYR